MALIRVCDQLIEMDMAKANCYRPFLLQSAGYRVEDVDLSFTRIHELPSPTTKRFMGSLRNMKAWHMTYNDEMPYWQFESDNGLCTVEVNEDYSRAEYHFSDVLSFFGNRVVENVLSNYFRIVIECRLLQAGLTILHAACVEEDGMALAFTGPSGIGKSTRAKKWVDLFDSEWISGDRPAVSGSRVIAYGVPWDGKEEVYRNVQRPLAAIVKVSRSSTPYVQAVDANETLCLLCEQSFLPLWDAKLAAKAIHSLRQLIANVPIVELGCDVSDESICEAHELLRGALGF